MIVRPHMRDVLFPNDRYGTTARRRATPDLVKGYGRRPAQVVRPG